MRRYLLPELGNDYKANLHCHTTDSDGKLTPERAKYAYQKRGYSVVAYTDHRVFIDRQSLTDDSFVAINAIEVDHSTESISKKPHVPCYHFNLYAMRPDIKADIPNPNCMYGDIYELNAYIKEWADKGFLVCYNHPYWSLHNYNDYAGLRGLWGMEIYNHGCEVEGLYGYHPQAYDEMLRASGEKLFCVAADDNHYELPFGHKRSDSFGGFVYIRAPKLDYETIMKALEAGDFYASTGARINSLYLEDNTLNITCTEADSIYVMTDTRRCYVKTTESEPMTEASFELKNDKYIRVVVTDTKGRRAFSSAYYL